MKGRFFSTLAAMVLAASAMAQDGPTMGWSSWNTFGVNINENLIKSQADAMVSTGLKDVGFNHDLPGNIEVKISCSHGRGHSFSLCLGN